MAEGKNSGQKEIETKRTGFMAGGGEMGARMRAYDWSKTSLGPVDIWPQSLRTTLSIILNSRFPMFLWWGQELIQFYNDAYRPSLGNNGKHPAALGQKGEESWPETWPIIKPLIDQVRSGGEATWSEDQLVPIYRNNSIEDVYWTFSFSPVYDEKGDVGGVLVVCTETTEKVANIKQLTESKENLQSAIDIAELGTFRVDVATKIGSYSEKVRDWFEFDSLSLPLDVIFGRVESQDRQTVLQSITKSLESEAHSRHDLHYRIRAAGDGRIRHLRSIGKALYTDGSPHTIIGIIQDVTPQLAAHEKLKASEEALQRFKFMADQARDIFVLMREDGSFAYLNNAALESWGYTEEEAMQLRVPDIDALNTYESFAALFKRAQKGTIPQFETQHKSKGGHRYPVEINVVSLILDEKPHLFAVARDITQHKEAEEAMHEKNAQLTRINNDLDNFIYTASHDLKAPISNIEGLMQILLRNLPAEILASQIVQRTTGLMQDSVERFKKTIANLTDVVKLQKENSGKAVMVDLLKVIEEVRLDLEQVIENSGAQIEVSLQDCSAIRFSEKNLRSVIYNLLSNAIKYSSPERLPQIQISCHSTPEYHVLSVKDNGLGMESSHSEQLFTMFKRYHSHVEGTGIGLYMIRKMIENAGGRIEVESQLGKGTTFRVYFRR